MNVTKSITVDRPSSEVYAFWRDFENLPRFMSNLERVENIGANQSHWCAKGIAGTEREWDAELVEDRPDERISWRTVGDDEHIRHAGVVSFTPIGESSTQVRVDLTYDAPGGKLGEAIAKLFGEEPGQQIEEDLERFKRVLETGDAEREYPRASELADRGFRTQEPVEPVGREIVRPPVEPEERL